MWEVYIELHETAELFSEVVIALYTLTSNIRIPGTSQPHQHFLLSTFILTSYSSSHVVMCIAVLICIPQWLMILNIIYVTIGHSCIFVCEISVKIFCPLKNLGSHLNIDFSHTISMSDICTVTIFSKVACLFIYVMGSFKELKFLMLKNSSLLIFFMVLALCGLRNLYTTQGVKR